MSTTVRARTLAVPRAGELTGGGPIGLLVDWPAHRWDRRRLSAEMLGLLHVHGARISTEVLTDVVPFDEAPQLFAELSARRRRVITAVLAVPRP